MEKHDHHHGHEEHKKSVLSHTLWSIRESYTTHRPVWILSLVFLACIITIIGVYEHRLSEARRDMYDFPRFHYSRPMIVYDDFFDFPRIDIDYEWRDMERRMAEMRKRQEEFWNSMEEYTPPSIIEGRYSGTRIINDTTFSYSLNIGKDTLSGSISGTNTGSIESLRKRIESLGYKVEKKDTGYTISGDQRNAEKLLELFR